MSLSTSSFTSPVASSSTLSPPMSASPAVGRPSRSSLSSQGVRTASVLGARPISSSTFQSRNGLAITPDSSAPPSPPLTTLQPSIRALPPPLTASNSGSGYRQPMTSTASMASGPNYNLSMSPQPPTMSMSLQPSSNAFMQPLQPQTSARPQPAVASAGIQWSTPTIAPQQATASGSWPAATPKPASAPPGWGGATVLQPTKKETTFDWGDLDPMR